MQNFYDAVRHLKCKVVYDIGANEGHWTKEAKDKLPDAEIYGFEANPQHADIENANRANRNFIVSLYHTDDCELDFHISETSKYTTGFSFYQERSDAFKDNHTIKLQTKRLDTFVKEQEIALPDAIKIDTQGSELDILMGAPECVEYAKVIMAEISLYEYNKGGVTFDTLNNWLQEHDYVPIGIEAQHRAANVLVQLDMVYVKRDLNFKYRPNDKGLE